MCFTPLASITTATVEVGIATSLFYKIKDRRLYPLAIFVLLLGLYQFSEFMLCKSSNAIFWARIGFATYTFMPILLYHFFVNVSGNKINNYFYFIPTFFSSLALFYPNFINYTSCNTLHVTVKNLVFSQSKLLMLLYWAYYFFYPVYGVRLFLQKISYKKMQIRTKLAIMLAPLAILAALTYYIFSTILEDNQKITLIHTFTLIVVCVLVLVLLSSFLFKKSKKLFYQTSTLVLATSCGTIVLLSFLMPNITLNYASIFCQFALLYGFAAILLVNSLGGRIPK